MPATAQDILASLVKEQKLTADQANAVSTESLSLGTTVEEILRKKKLVNDEDLARVRAELLGIPFVTLVGKAISPEVTSFIPEPVARRYSLIPFSYDDKEKALSVAMTDPLTQKIFNYSAPYNLHFGAFYA